MPAVPGGSPAPPVDLSRLPADMQALVTDPEAFKRRLEEAGNAAVGKLLKEAGFKKPEELTAALKAHKDHVDAQKTQAERDAARIAELGPKAEQADKLLEGLKVLLAAEEGAVPAEHKGKLDKLAPPATDPAGRLTWIVNARAEGLFGAAPAPKPASSKAGPTPPPAAPQQGGKPVAEMSDAEFREYKRRRFSEGPATS